MYLLDVKRTRVMTLDGWVQRISFIYVLSDREEHIEDNLVEIPREDYKQSDITLREPIEVEDLAMALESLADYLRNSSNA